MKPVRTLAFVLTIVTIVGCGSQSQNEETELSIPVTVVDVKPSTIHKFINTSGTVYAVNQAILNSEMRGQYNLLTNPATGRPYKLGDRVRKGQVIIRLEDKEYENGIAIESKKLQLAVNRIELILIPGACSCAMPDCKILKGLYRKGLIRFSPAADVFTRMMTYTAQHPGKRRFFPDDLDGLCILTVRNKTDIAWDIDTCRAGVLTGPPKQFGRFTIFKI